MKNKNYFPAAFAFSLLRSAQKTLIGFSKAFGDKRQRKIFLAFCLSLITQGSPIFSRVREITGVSKNWAVSLSEFLKNQSWSSGLIEQIHRSFVKKHLKKIKYVVLDFSALVKDQGKKFEYLCSVYDGRDKKIHLGYSLLLALGTDEEGKIRLPLIWEIISYFLEDFKGENLFILGLLDRLLEYLKKVGIEPKNLCFLLDRGFDRPEIIKWFIDHEIPFMLRLRENRNIKLIKAKKKTNLTSLAPGYYPETLITKWKVKLNLAVVEQIEEVNEKNETEKEEIGYLLTNLDLKDKNSEEIKGIYKIRSLIEGVFRELKQNFGLEKFQARSFQTIKKIIALIMFCFSICQTALAQWKELVVSGAESLLQIKKKYFETIRLTMDLVRQILRKIAFFGYNPDFWLILAENQGPSP